MQSDLNKGFLLFAFVATICAYALREFVSVSPGGLASGLVYGALSINIYGKLVQLLTSGKSDLIFPVFLLSIKLFLLCIFVYMLASSTQVFIWSSLAGFAQVVPAGIWASWRSGQHNKT